MKQLSYKKAWEYLDNMTPLNTDCGVLCGNACCKGSDDDGMLLFPGEEAMYTGEEDGFHIRDSHILLSDGTPVKLLVCRGRCDRKKRPLSCRIFPIIPQIDSSDYLIFVPDMRAATLCPLLFRSARHAISPAFIDALYLAFATLIEDERVLEFIDILTSQNDDLARELERFYR